MLSEELDVIFYFDFFSGQPSLILIWQNTEALFSFSSQEEPNGFCAKISLSSSPACLPFAQRDKILFCQISAVYFPIKRLQAILEPKKGVGIFNKNRNNFSVLFIWRVEYATM